MVALWSLSGCCGSHFTLIVKLADPGSNPTRDYDSSMIMLLYYLDPLQNQTIMTSRCMLYVFCQGREVKHWDESILSVTKKEGKEKVK